MKWEIKDAVNFDRFEVERTSNGRTFTKVHTVAYSASVSSYSFKDNNLTNGRYQYRLKMVDIDGKYEYSIAKAIAVDCSNSAIVVLPTLATNEIFVQGLSKPATVKIYASNGQLMIEKQLINNNERIDISNLSIGAYVVQVIANGTVLNTTRILRQQ